MTEPLSAIALSSTSTSRRVPAGVPSVDHRSPPSTKYRRPLNGATGPNDMNPAPGAVRRRVPDALPSVTQRPLSPAPDSARKYTRPPTASGQNRLEPIVSGLTSARRDVPAGVPSVVQGSKPFSSSGAAKISFDPSAAG